MYYGLMCVLSPGLPLIFILFLLCSQTVMRPAFQPQANAQLISEIAYKDISLSLFDSIRDRVSTK
jgi:hypothetical protein